jgi:hypothetical protein
MHYIYRAFPDNANQLTDSAGGNMNRKNIAYIPEWNDKNTGAALCRRA